MESGPDYISRMNHTMLHFCINDLIWTVFIHTALALSCNINCFAHIMKPLVICVILVPLSTYFIKSMFLTFQKPLALDLADGRERARTFFDNGDLLLTTCFTNHSQKV